MKKHPKMQYTYVGIDSHKQTHTAVFLDCFFEKLGEITFSNLPSCFDAFINDAQQFRQEDTVLFFGLEDTSFYGRMLMVYLKENNHPVKHIPAFEVAQERKILNITRKTDSVDAECAGRVLLSKFNKLPDAVPHDEYWILRTLVSRRKYIVRNNWGLKNSLHALLAQHYPNYYNFFFDVTGGKTAIEFFMRYPSPGTLKDTTVEELADFLSEFSANNFGEEKAKMILDSLEDIGFQYQDTRDKVVQSIIRQIKYNNEEIESLEELTADVLARIGSTLTSMNGLDTVSVSQLLSCIGDIRKFSTPAKLARYAGIAPITYASGNTDSQYANARGNRELNSLLYNLAVRLICVCHTSTNKVINPFFYEYYYRKISEGKTKRQAIKCIQRRLINILWSMMTYNEAYVNPPMREMPILDKEKEKARKIKAKAK